MKKENLPDFPDNGFVIVASMFEAFYKAAIELAESIKLFYPEAHITVFTSHEEWIKPTDWNHADWIVHWEVPNEIRAKLWALSQTPYKGKTVYFDADMVCESEEIENIFDQLPDDLDLIFTKIRPYNAKVTKLTNTEEMTAHCGMFLYRNNPHTIKLMEDWYGEYHKQNLKNPTGGWVHELGGNYPDDVRVWDTFTMWRLLTYGDSKVKWDENLHIRWNFINGHLDSELEGEEIVFWHYTIPQHEIHPQRK